jgi:hypothetical protein
MKSSIPLNCPWGSARSCHMAHIHFWLPNGGPVMSLHVHASLPCGPPAEGPACRLILACHVGPRMRKRCAMKSSIPMNCPWGSACSCHIAPIHFQLPLGSPVLSLQVCASLPVPRRPPAEGPACSERDLASW